MYLVYSLKSYNASRIWHIHLTIYYVFLSITSYPYITSIWHIHLIIYYANLSISSQPFNDEIAMEFVHHIMAVSKVTLRLFSLFSHRVIIWRSSLRIYDTSEMHAYVEIFYWWSEQFRLKVLFWISKFSLILLGQIWHQW